MAKKTPEKPWLAAVFFIFAFVLLALRRPDPLLRPQFWAEDGAVWYAQAHDLGALPPFLMTQDGYFSTYLRVVAALAQVLPLAAAPLFFAVVAFALQIAPAAFLLSKRFAKAAPDYAARLGLALLLLVLPNTAEIHGNATNAQWYLALLACMVVLAEPAASLAWRAFDVATLALAGLSGPYAVFLAPLAYLRWRKSKKTARRTQTLVLAACGAVQLAALLLMNRATRFHVLPRADLGTLFAILGKQVFGGGLVGIGGYLRIANHHPAFAAAFFAALAAAGCVLTATACVRGPWQLKYLIAFAALSLAASLAAPNLGPLNLAPDYAARAWRGLLESSTGSRYWFLPIVAWVATLAWGTSRPNPKPLRVASAALLALLCIGVATDLRDPAPADTGFVEQVRRYEALPPGATMDFAIAPPGWTMTLIKK